MGAPLMQNNEEDDLKKPNSQDNSSLSTYLALIQQYLGVLRIENAAFLAERCVAEYPDSSDAVYLLALCHYRQGSPKRAQLILEQCACTSHNISYLQATCLYELKEYAKAEEILLREARAAYRKERTDDTPMDLWILQQSPCPVPNGAVGLALLGDICRYSERIERACTYYRMSLKLDPFLWTSFTALSEISGRDDNVSPTDIFGVAPKGQAPPTAPQTALAAKTPLQAMSTPAAPPQKLFQSTVLRNRVSQLETPNLTPIPVNASMAPAETPRMPPPQTPLNPGIVRRAKDVAMRSYYPPSPDTPLTNVTKSMKFLRGLGPPQSENERGVRDLFQENTQSNRNLLPPTDDLQKPDRDPKVNEILELLATAGYIFLHNRKYRCKEALQALQALPLHQLFTGWVLHQQGKAHLEMSDFHSARRSFEQMQKVDPSRVQGLELLSTVYWQLKKEVELASLAQRVIEIDRLSPEAWCIMGNCFSLQKDHETALVYFKRSLQLDPNFTYTHTLAGYEYMANEDFAKAEECFRKAISTDSGHYNAWYGLGAIDQRQEKYDTAESHFARAVELHPTSSVLRCNLGIAQYANKNPYQALDTLNAAFRLDPNNPQARYQRATIFTAMNKNEEALKELQKVRDAAPREATVHFAMGKVLKKLGRSEEAMKCFLAAMDLDPKDNQAIKAAMDKLDEPDVEEEAIDTF